MRITRTRTTANATVALLALLSVLAVGRPPEPAAAATTQPEPVAVVFEETASPLSADFLLADRQLTRARVVKPPRDLLELTPEATGRSLDIAPFEDFELRVEDLRLRVTQFGGLSLYGLTSGPEGPGELHLYIESTDRDGGGRLMGFARSGSRTVSFEPDSVGNLVLGENADAAPRGDAMPEPEPGGVSGLQGLPDLPLGPDDGGGMQTQAQPAGSVYDPMEVLMVYTAAAQSYATNRWGSGGLEYASSYQLVVANDVMINSNLPTRFARVGLLPVADPSSSNACADAIDLGDENDGAFDEVDTWKDQYYADIVTLMGHGYGSDGDGGGGCIGNWIPFMQPQPSSAAHVRFNAWDVTVGGTSDEYFTTFIHETGHNLDLWHSSNSPSQMHMPAWFRGFVNTTANFATIEGVQNAPGCPGGWCARALFFSDPTRTYGTPQYPRGDSTHNEVRALRESLVVGARYDLSPWGNLDSARQSVSGTQRGISIGGWAMEPDHGAAATDVHVYVDGAWGGSLSANQSRPDVAAAYPGYTFRGPSTVEQWRDWGSNHGYSGFIPTSAGTHTVCAYGINKPGTEGDNRLLGCKTVSVTRNPIGDVNSRTVVPGKGVRFVGWTFDPDSVSPNTAQGYVGSAHTETVASVSRPDVAAVYPEYGPLHGFDFHTFQWPGYYTTCVYGWNLSGTPGSNQQLGPCVDVTIPGDTFGNLDSAVRSGSSIVVGGWAIDPDNAASIQVHVYVDGAWGGLAPANVNRPDIGSAYPNYGPNHGFSFSVPASSGPHQVCAYGINTYGGGTNSLLGCRNVSS